MINNFKHLTMSTFHKIAILCLMILWCLPIVAMESFNNPRANNNPTNPFDKFKLPQSTYDRTSTKGVDFFSLRSTMEYSHRALGVVDQMMGVAPQSYTYVNTPEEEELHREALNHILNDARRTLHGFSKNMEKEQPLSQVTIEEVSSEDEGSVESCQDDSPSSSTDEDDLADKNSTKINSSQDDESTDPFADNLFDQIDGYEKNNSLDDFLDEAYKDFIDIQDQVNRDRSVEKKQIHKTKRSKSPTRLQDTYYAQGEDFLVEGVKSLQEAKERFKSGKLKHTWSEAAKVAGAYGLDGVVLVNETLDKVTFGLWGKTWDKVDEGIDWAGTKVRRSLRDATGNQRFGQNAGECTILALNLFNPGKLAKAQKLAKLARINKVNIETKVTQLVQRVPGHKSNGSTPIKGLDLEKPKKSNLLPGEGKVGSYGDLNKHSSKPKDNLAAHHIPNDQYMKTRGIRKNDGISMTVEDPFPGKGGRHREIHKELKKQNPKLEPREALAQSLQRARDVYREQNLLPEIRPSLLEVAKQNKEKFPEIFKK